MFDGSFVKQVMTSLIDVIVYYALILYLQMVFLIEMKNKI